MSAGGSNSVVNQAMGGYNQVINLVTGYNPANGKTSFGGSGTDVGWLNEAIGSIDGSNSARHALGVAGDAQIAAQKQANDLIAQENVQKGQADLNASQTAQAERTSAANAPNLKSSSFLSATAPVAYGQKLGSNNTDFLGA